MGHDKPRIGLALGCGGARGWCHIGVLRELAEMGITPHVISGSSIGALVAAVHAGGALDALEDWARKLTARSFLGMLDVRLASGGIVEGTEILTVLRRMIEKDRIEDLACPLAIVATDMASGREVWFTEGDVADAVRASVALPGVISPYRLGDRWFLDGGLTNPVPVSACRILGAEVVIAVNPNGRSDGTFWAERERDAPALWTAWSEWFQDLPAPLAGFFEKGPEKEPRPHYLDVVSTSIDIMTEVICRSKLAGDPPHVALDVHLSKLSVLEFHRAEEAIEEGRRIVRQNADKLAACARL